MESELLTGIKYTLRDIQNPSQRTKLVAAVRDSLSTFKSLLFYPGYNPKNRNEVKSKTVMLKTGPISLDDWAMCRVIELSDYLGLNEIDCTRLLVAAKQKWGLLDSEPLEVQRFAAGCWYTERREKLTDIFVLFRAVVLDQDHDAAIVADIKCILEELVASGFRKRLTILIMDLRKVERTGSGAPLSERYIIDSKGFLVEREAVVLRERLILCHCLVLSLFVGEASHEDVIEILIALKDSTLFYGGESNAVKAQITFSLLFSLVITFTSDALCRKPDILYREASLRDKFQKIVMANSKDPTMEGFVGCVRLAWAVYLILVLDGDDRDHIIANNILPCLEVTAANNVFQFWVDKILRTAAYQNDDKDMTRMYNAHLHKQMISILSHPLLIDKIMEGCKKPQTNGMAAQSFVSLLEFVNEFYQKVPELLDEVRSNSQILVVFLKMLSTLACNDEGASKVFELLQGKTLYSIGWSTMFDSLSAYEEKFKQATQSFGAVLPEFDEGDAEELVAYLSVLKKVVESGNPVERKNWFPDIEPLFKLLCYRDMPPHLKGELRNAIATFVHMDPVIKDTVWRFLDQYDIPVVTGPTVGSSGNAMGTQIYDMRYELNEIEARRERYPSTISFLNLLNSLIAEEKDSSDRGHRFIGIFRFIYDHIFGLLEQRAYADPCEKWQLVVASLKHFQMMLSMYEIDVNSDAVADQYQLPMAGQSSLNHMQLPIIEIMKDFMSGKTVFWNVMAIVSPGVDFLITERNQMHGLYFETAILLSLELIILIMEKDSLISNSWGPHYRPLHVILSEDHSQILVALLEYVRYATQPQIQLCSIKILSILSSRTNVLPHVLLKHNAATGLTKDYATCLELHSKEKQIVDHSSEDPGVLIIQLLIDNVNKSAPNITHLLLQFDVNGPVKRTVLQPEIHYSCLTVVLGILDNLFKPDVNAFLHEFGFQLLRELCVNPLTSGPVMNLLCTKNYRFFVKHLNSLGVAPLPSRIDSQALRISSLHQRAWLLKLLAVELHSADMMDPIHNEACQAILVELFESKCTDHSAQRDGENTRIGPNMKSKVLELLEMPLFRSPDIKPSQFVSNSKYSALAQDILYSVTSGRSVFYYSERGDRLIDLASFRNQLWQECNLSNPQLSSNRAEAELTEVREETAKLLTWACIHNKNLEEQASQLHMLTSWSQVVEVLASQKIQYLQTWSEELFQLLDASLSASGSNDVSLEMAQILTRVGLTCMAKLRDEQFVFPGGLNSDNPTCIDIIKTKCHSILFKLIMAIRRHDSSEVLRQRQYALLLSYFQYRWHMLDSALSYVEQEEYGDLDLEKINKGHSELVHADFELLRENASPILSLVTRDATQGSQFARVISLYVLDAFIRVDHNKFFLNELQSRDFLRTCVMNIGNFSYQGMHSIESMQRLCTLAANLSLLLRISHKYGKSGSKVLCSMYILERIASLDNTLNVQLKENLQRADTRVAQNSSVDIDIISPTLRLVFSLTSLVDASQVYEVYVVREIIRFVKRHRLLFDQILQEDFFDANELIMEQINLVVGILGKVWLYEETNEYGFTHGVLFKMMRAIFSCSPESFSSVQLVGSEKPEWGMTRLCLVLSSYLSILVTRKSLKLQMQDSHVNYRASAGNQPPTLSSLVFLLGSLTTALERASEDKHLLFNKIKNINELSRQEVEIINLCPPQSDASSFENTQKWRQRNRLIMLLLLITKDLINIFLAHFQDSSYQPGQNDFLLHPLGGALTPILKRLKLLSEDKTGHSLTDFRRLVQSLKEKLVSSILV